MRISKAEFCRHISSHPSTFMGVTRGIVGPDCLVVEPYLDPDSFTEIREARVRSRDIEFTGHSYLALGNKDFYAFSINGETVLACACREPLGITCYYLLRK